MERKSIGAFIAALRKASGMTQRELAERLNVSDKSVSRWERDDSAPDLSLIPVIAEVFGVTSDELLRGERRTAAAQEEPDGEDKPRPKTEKQRRRLIAAGLSRYKARSFVSAGLAAVGLLAAMAGNFGFNRAYIGFLAGAVFYIAAAVCQAIFMNSALLTVNDEELAGPEVERFKRSVIVWAQRVISLAVVLLFVSLPLIIYPGDAYVGLTAGSWFGRFALPYGGGAVVLCALVCYFLTSALVNRGAYLLTEREATVYRRNFALKRGCGVVLAALLIVTFIANVMVTDGWNTMALARGTVFNDIESFKEFMETDVPAEHYDYGTAAPEREPGGKYYNLNGEEITEEEALRRTLTDGDGNVLCEYIERNGSVSVIRHGDSIPPITVFTQSDMRVARSRLESVNAAFIAAAVLEVVGVFVFYFLKRAK